MAKEKLEDLQYLDELYGLARKLTLNKDPRIGELEEEIQAIKLKIATHDYTPLEARRQASLRRFGKDSAYY